MKEHAFDFDKPSLLDDQDTSGSVPAQPSEAQNNDIPDLIELTDVVEPLDQEPEKAAAEFTLLDDTFSFLDERAESAEDAAEVEEDTLPDLFKLIDGPNQSSAGEGSEPEEPGLIAQNGSIAVEELLLDDEPEGLLRLDDILNQEDNVTPPLCDLSGSADDLLVPDVEETAVTLTPTAIEKAIDHIIQKRYGQNIEEMIATIVEKVVLREMQALKRSLLEDEDDPAE